MKNSVKIYLRYLFCFLLTVLFLFPLSCAKRLPPKVEKKPPPLLLKKPPPQKVKKKKEVKPIVPEKEVAPERAFILPSYFNTKDNSDMAYIPAGHFVMGDNEGEENEKPAAKVLVRSFYIDIYEITNKQYKLFDHEFENSSSMNCDQCPVTYVTWEDAESYCKWAGKRLPSEVEWEKAAKGTQQLKWPWGNLPLKDRANILENPESQSDDGYNDDPTPVGSFPQGSSVSGVLDMAGNVWEWTNSIYLPYNDNIKRQVAATKRARPELVEGSDRPEEQTENSSRAKLSFAPKEKFLQSNIKNSDFRYKKEYRVLRGGSWKNILGNARTTFRHPLPPETKLPNIGFRCAKGVS